jgi:hypothetical protein
LHLMDALFRLAETIPPMTTSLATLAGVCFEGIQDVMLEHWAPSGRARAKIRSISSGRQRIVHWAGDGEEWTTRALLLEGLLSQPSGGHQYLTGYESLDPIEVEVSFRETDPTSAKQ